MKIISQNNFNVISLIRLKDQNWLEKQRVAGKVIAGTLSLLESLVKEKTTKSLIELNSIAEEYILKNNCTCTFKNYKGFPAGVCISVNKQLVHGIPTNYYLQDGDIVTFDLGATFEGAIADSAITCIFGNPKSELHQKVVSTTQDALMKGIEAVKIGQKLGNIGYSISRVAKKAGLNIIENYGGHGLDWNTPHSAPFVANKSTPDEGIIIQPGLSIAIEPMLTDGSTRTWVDNDGWTVWCDSNISAHFEHSIFVHENTVEIITDRNVTTN